MRRDERKGQGMGTPEQVEYRYNRLTWPEMNAAIARQLSLCSGVRLLVRD